MCSTRFSVDINSSSLMKKPQYAFSFVQLWLSKVGTYIEVLKVRKICVKMFKKCCFLLVRIFKGSLIFYIQIRIFFCRDCSSLKKERLKTKASKECSRCNRLCKVGGWKQNKEKRVACNLQQLQHKKKKNYEKICKPELYFTFFV